MGFLIDESAVFESFAFGKKGDLKNSGEIGFRTAKEGIDEFLKASLSGEKGRFEE